ncbi:hypothetical protein [Lignipirellula cremea]|uniref:Uncharacterized protein n=1 Tax=Lignipirellula cremea TaxID=2528010 RepID=A0A518E3H4_9BACT|nr:hypothetical protein [Lignipirellula cremea]QDU98639.1 hypothetical protein Pla8534_65110 [Lignipirellula cremea]
MTDSPRDPGKPPASRGWLAIALAVFAGVLFFIVLSFLTLGYVGPVVVVVALVFAASGFHYLTWGWWLTRHLRDRYPPDEDDF